MALRLLERSSEGCLPLGRVSPMLVCFLLFRCMIIFCRVLAAEGAVAWARQEGLPICQPDDLITGRDDVTISQINSLVAGYPQTEHALCTLITNLDLMKSLPSHRRRGQRPIMYVLCLSQLSFLTMICTCSQYVRLRWTQWVLCV